MPKFWWRPKTPIFIVVSGDQAEEAEISKTPIQGVRETGPFLDPLKKGRWQKKVENLKIHYVLKG